MDKAELTNKIKKWLSDFLQKRYSSTHEILEVVIPNTNLARLPNDHIKSCTNYSAWEFKPDVLGILKNKATNEIELVFVNRSVNSLSLKEIGEIYCYSKLANVELAFLISPNGVSNEVNLLLLEDEIRNRLLCYEKDAEIIICSWDEDGDTIDSSSVIPLDRREFLTE